MADEAGRRARRYQTELPADMARAAALLEGYSNIAAEEVEPRLRDIRERAWAIFPYGCIGRWRFLDLYITTLPDYPSIIGRIQSGQVFLDAGCCLGYVLRQLVFDGAPAVNLIGADLRQEFLDLGYELFGDRGKFGGRFVAGNMLEPSDPALAQLDGKVDIIHAASFFHLFGYDDQLRLGERLVRFFRADAEEATLFGRQVANFDPPDPDSHEARELVRYLHNPETLQRLWDVIGERTGTRWKATATMAEEERGVDSRRVTMKFLVRRLG